MNTTHAPVAHWLGKVAEALKGLERAELDYGTFYISEIIVSFDGEPAGVKLVANDFGSLDVQIGDDR